MIVQGAWVGEDEIQTLVTHWKRKVTGLMNTHSVGGTEIGNRTDMVVYHWVKHNSVCLFGVGHRPL